MLDTLVVGAGLCGLSLASKLQFAGRDYLLVEARPRLGGRIETVRGDQGHVFDMGPTWFWPETQPLLTRLIADLGLSHFAQHDSGSILHLAQGDGRPEVLNQAGVHNNSQRVVGGIGAIVDALAQRLAIERIRLGYTLSTLVDHGSFVEARCTTGTETVVFQARRVVLALPPRLLDEQVGFSPELPADLRETLRATPTWMAAQAKAMAGFDTAFWRAEGFSGNAFVTHPQAVLAEVFDACGEAGEAPALGGFVALPAGAREAYKLALAMMVSSQFGQLYGPRATDDANLHLRDWATEPFTCSALDVAEPNEHPYDGVALLATPCWDGRLLLAGSETAGQGAGYLEGALDAAARVWRQLGPAVVETTTDVPLGERNQASLAAFSEWVSARRAQALAGYREALVRALSSQQHEAITQQAMLEVVGGLYAEALAYLRTLSFDTRSVPVDKGRSALTPLLLQSFVGFSDALLTEAVTHNATSCAISNFPAEHDPDAAYLQAIRRELAQHWKAFALAVNDRVLERKRPANPS